MEGLVLDVLLVETLPLIPSWAPSSALAEKSKSLIFRFGIRKFRVELRCALGWSLEMR